MAVTLNKANLVLKDANGNIGKIEQLSDRDLAKIRTAVSDVALVVNQSNHTPIEATTTNKGVVQLATPADVVSGASDKVVTAEQLHNSTTGTSALATENLARIDAVVTEAGISVDHTNTNQLKTAVTTLISNATPATATANTLGVVKPDNDTITIDSNGVLTATAQMPGVATNATVGVVKPDGSTITVNGDGTLTATAQMPGVATASSVGVVKPDNDTITVGADGTLTATAQMPGVATASSVGMVKPDNDTITVGADGTLTATAQMPGVATTTNVGVVKPDGRTITITADGVISAIGSGGGSGSSVTGEIKWFAFNKAPNGYLVCNGAQVSRTTYANLFKAIGTTFGKGDGSTTFTLPNLIDKFAQGSTTVGTVKSAGLPNIKGEIVRGSSALKFTGSFYGGSSVNSTFSYASNYEKIITFSASRSNSIYGNSTTVQPPALTLLPCIKY